jgi:hypothetical protein
MDVKGRSASAPASPCVVLGDDAADAAAVAKVDRKYGSMLNAGSPLQILYTDQLADAKGGLKVSFLTQLLLLFHYNICLLGTCILWGEEK